MLIVCFFDVEKGPALVAKVFVCMELYAGANTLNTHKLRQSLHVSCPKRFEKLNTT